MLYTSLLIQTYDITEKHVITSHHVRVIQKVYLDETPRDVIMTSD